MSELSESKVAERSIKPLHIVYLSANSGGGHNGAAQGLTELAARHFGPAVEQTTLNIYSARRTRWLPFLSRIRYHSDRLWQLFFWTTDRPWAVRLTRRIIGPFMIRRILRQLPEHVDVLVALHFIPAQLVAEVASKLPNHPKTAILPTDYEAHMSYFGQADRIAVTNQHGERRALMNGYSVEQIIQLALLPCQQIAQTSSHAKEATQAIRILVSAGGDGSSTGKMTQLLERLVELSRHQTLQVEVVCGHNDGLLARLNANPRIGGCTAIQLNGFVSDFPARLQNADLALLRAGPQSLTEAIAAATPVIAFDWSAHESAQVRLIEKLGIGFASRKADAVATAVERFFTDHAWRTGLENRVTIAQQQLPGPELMAALVPNCDTAAEEKQAPAETKEAA